MARPLSRFTKQLLHRLSPIGEGIQASTRYWGKMGVVHLINDLTRDLSETIEEIQVRRGLQRLRARGWVAGQHHRLQLTPDGLAAARRIGLDDLNLKHPVRWDGVWRIVIWDIPEAQRRLRDVIRRTLARLGFIRIQQSVWVTPLPCQEEIAGLRAELGIQHGLLYLEAGKIEGERLLRQHFKVG